MGMKFNDLKEASVALARSRLEPQATKSLKRKLEFSDNDSESDSGEQLTRMRI